MLNKTCTIEKVWIGHLSIVSFILICSKNCFVKVGLISSTQTLNGVSGSLDFRHLSHLEASWERTWNSLLVKPV